MKKLFRFTSVFTFLSFFIPFLNYNTSRMPKAAYVSYFEILTGLSFTVDGAPYGSGFSLHAALVLAFSAAAVIFSFVFGNKKILLRISVLFASAASLYYFILVRGDFGADSAFVSLINGVVKGGVEFRVNVFYAVPIALLILNIVTCLTTERFSSNIVKYKWWYLMTLPSALFVIVFVYVPMAGLSMMFVDLNINEIFKSTFVGLKWFRMLKDNLDSDFGVVLVNTVVIAAQRFAVTFPAPIILAILVNECRNKYYKKTVQSITYLPHFISWSIIGGLIITLFNSDFSFINGVRKMMDEHARGFYLLNEVTMIRGTLVLSSLWKTLGWSSIIYIAALTAVNPELYESARLDGAGKFAQIVHITIPGISAIIVLQFIFAMPSLIADNMDQALNLVYPLTVAKSKTLSLYIYEIGIKNRGSYGMSGNYSFSAAIGFCNQIISFCLLMFGNTIGKRINPEGAVW